MLERYSDPYEFENRLKNHIQSVRLIGQIPLSEKDINQIINYIKTNLAGKFSENMDKILEDTPSTFACYLVWKGIQNYDEGTYWNIINEEIGPIDANQQGKLGQFFRDFIEENNLFIVEIPRARRNITPILLHGIIPKEMIQDFFEHVIYPLYRKELVNPTDESEISYWLKSRRKLFQKYQDTRDLKIKLKDLLRDIDNEETNLDNLKKHLATLDAKSKNEENVQRGLEKIEPLIGQYDSGLAEIGELKHIRNVLIEDLQKYQDILDFNAKLDIDGYRNKILNSILESIASSINDPDFIVQKEAYDLLGFFYQANLHGKMKMTSEQAQQINEIYRNSRNNENI